MCVRYLLTDRPLAGLTISPVLGTIAGSRDLSGRLGMLEVGADRRLSFMQKPGEACSLYVRIPQCKYLDFSLGLEDVGGGPRGDSPGAEIVLRGRGGGEISLRSGPLAGAGETWADYRLDLSGLVGESAAIVLKTTGTGGEVGWSGFDFVLEDCMVRVAGEGYEIDTRGSGATLALRLMGPAGEHSIGLARAGRAGGYESRFVRFEPPMGYDMVFVEPGAPGKQVLIRTGKGIDVVEARLINTPSDASLGWCPFYDGDMFIYENQAALPRGICVPRSLFGEPGLSGGGPEMLEITRVLKDLPARASGLASVRSYETGRVVVDVVAEEASVLILQDTYYPGWRALVDGNRMPLLKTDLGILALPVEEGEHEVILEFKPRSFTLGLGLSILGILLGVLYGAKTKR
jgi:hypothetical protein